VVSEVFEWLSRRIDVARERGVNCILADIGFGFAKTADDNMKLLREHSKFSGLGVPMVLGVSRKSTIGKILGGVPPAERINGSVAAAVYGSLNGAKVIRTHDVRQTVDAVKISDAMARTQ
jgi:dihydropteroate synthase